MSGNTPHDPEGKIKSSLGRMVVDKRIGGCPRYYMTMDDRPLMRIPDGTRKCVAFLQYRTRSGEVHPAGTAFITIVSLADRLTQGATYLVTARHVIENIDSRSVDGIVLVRLNGKSGPITVEISLDHWQFHPDDRVDIAAAWIYWHEDFIDSPFPSIAFATADFNKANSIGIGDDVIAMGLFWQHIGTQRNIPILRTGVIAAMPEEPIQTARGLMDGYLIELRSIGGLSGSPVFLNQGGLKLGNDGYVRLEPRVGFRFLGLIHGHWDLPTSIEEAATDEAPIVDNPFKAERLNTGIGVVIPADKALDVLNCEAFSLHRESVASSIIAANLPTEDTSVREQQ